MDKFYPQLEKRQDKGVTPYNLRNCAYHAEFERSNIAWSDISISPNFTLLPKNFYVNNTAYLINSDDKYLLGVLNSDVAAHYMNLISTSLGEKGERYFKQFVEQIPVPKPSIIHQRRVEEIVQAMLRKSNSSADIYALEKEKNQLIYKIYQLTQKEVEIIKARNSWKAKIRIIDEQFSISCIT